MIFSKARSHGVMVSTLDFESSDPSSNLGGTSYFLISSLEIKLQFANEVHTDEY